MAGKTNHQVRIFLALMVFALKDVSGLKCEVGYNNETQVLECEGSWDEMKTMMAEKLGSQWESIQQNITGMTGIIETLSNQFNDIKQSIQNVLKPAEDSRRKREAEEAEPEPEPEPEPSDDYYCIKNSLAGNTLKSCLPKAVADPIKMACSLIPGTGSVCVCNDQDVCNSAGFLSSQVTVTFLDDVKLK